MQLQVSFKKRVLVFVCAVATEAISWSGILVAGLGWIFTSRSVHDIIRSTVCIMFVQNVDEVVYEVKTITSMGLLERVLLRCPH